MTEQLNNNPSGDLLSSLLEEQPLPLFVSRTQVSLLISIVCLRIDLKKQEWGPLSNREGRGYLSAPDSLCSGAAPGCANSPCPPTVCSRLAEKDSASFPTLVSETYGAETWKNSLWAWRRFPWGVHQMQQEAVCHSHEQPEPERRLRQQSRFETGSRCLFFIRRWDILLSELSLLCTHSDKQLISGGWTLSSWGQTLNLYFAFFFF